MTKATERVKYDNHKKKKEEKTIVLPDLIKNKSR